MEIKLIKPHKFGNKTQPANTVVGVTVCVGMDLVDKGIGIDTSGKYKKVVKKPKQEQKIKTKNK